MAEPLTLIWCCPASALGHSVTGYLRKREGETLPPCHPPPSPKGFLSLGVHGYHWDCDRNPQQVSSGGMSHIFISVPRINHLLLTLDCCLSPGACSLPSRKCVSCLRREHQGLGFPLESGTLFTIAPSWPLTVGISHLTTESWFCGFRGRLSILMVL